MADTRTLQILIEAKDNASKQLKGLSGQLKSMQPAFQKMALIGTASFVAISAGIGKTVKGAMIAEGAISKFNAVFKEGSENMMSFVEDIRKEMPSATTDIIKMASGLQDLLVPIGIARSEAQEMTKGFLDLSNKIGAFNDVNPTEVLDAIRSGLTGISMPLKRFGIDSSITGLEALALKEGLIKVGESFANLEPQVMAQVRAQALLLQITKQSDDAIQGFADNQDSALRRNQEITASIEDLSDEIGDIFLPMVDEALKKIIPIIKKISEWVKENQTLIKILAITALSVTGLVATIGTLGLILPFVITGLGFLGKAMIVLKGISLSLSGVLIFAIISILAVLAMKLMETRKQVENWGQVFEVVGLSIRSTVMKMTSFVVEKFGEMLNAIGIGGDKYIEMAQRMRRESVYLAIEADNIKDKTKKLNAELEAEASNASNTSNSVDTLSGALGLLGSETEDTEAKIEGLNSKIESLYESTAQIGQAYKKEERGNQASYIEDIVKTVADAEEERATFQDEYNKLISETPDKLDELKKEAFESGGSLESVIKRVEAFKKTVEEQKATLQTSISKQNEIISTYKKSEMNLDENVAERRRYLNLNELDQLAYDYEKKQELSQRNYLIDTATNLLRIENYRDSVNEMLVVDVSYSSSVIENAQLVTDAKRDELDIQTQDLQAYLNKQKSLYSSHYAGLGLTNPYSSMSDNYVQEKNYYIPKNTNSETQSNKETIINIDMRGATITDETITEKMSENLLKNLAYIK